MPDARDIGERVLAGLVRARAERWPDFAARVEKVRRELDIDILSGRPAHGRAARISRKVRIPVSTVKRILTAQTERAIGWCQIALSQTPEDAQ